MTLPKHYDTTNMVDMVHWCRVLRKRYVLSGSRDAVERTYTMCARIKRAREKETYATTQKSMEGYRELQTPEDDERFDR